MTVNLVLLAPAVAAFLAGLGMYRFAAHVRDRSAKLRAEPAAEVAAKRPFDHPIATQSLYDSMTAIVRKAKRKGPAVNIPLPNRLVLAKQKDPERERAA